MLERYVWRTILPYFLLAWLLLTVILFLQQGSRLTEILFGAQIPARLVLELSASLVLTVVSFTAPMALLTGIVVGLGQLRGDSELTAFFAAGFGKRRVVLPCLLLGAAVSAAAFAVNLRGVPFAAAVVRRVALEAALLKLESPIEPGVFNTEFNNYVIYVKDGDNERGVWERVFIYFPEKEAVKLITARAGRIDAADDKSELVLSGAVVTTLPLDGDKQPVTLEKVENLRITLETGRRQLRQRLESFKKQPDEMGLDELAAFAAANTGKERREAEILWHRRLALSVAPLILSLLGAALSLRTGRGGRGWGAVLSLGAMVFYYLAFLLGEQMARAGILPPFVGCWLATAAAGLLGVWWLSRSAARAPRVFSWSVPGWLTRRRKKTESGRARRIFSLENVESGFFGLLERDIWLNLIRYFLLTSAVLLLLFHVFTVFEVLRGLSAPNGGWLLARYLLLLSPLVLWQIAPTALMIAVLVTYTAKARQNETIVWGAAGQSLYVLLLPCVLCAALLGAVNWEWQEVLLPQTNPRQDALRSQLRGAGSVGSQEGRFWVAAPNGLISFTALKGSDNGAARNVTFYQFDADATHLRTIQKGDEANWNASRIELTKNVSETTWRQSYIETLRAGEAIALDAGENPFTQTAAKTADLNAQALENLAEVTESSADARRLRVALQRKYTTLFLPLVLIFFSAPLALSIRRQGNIGKSLGFAVGVWLLFMASVSLFERLGNEGLLPPLVAVWSPLLIFSSFGWYLLAKLRS